MLDRREAVVPELANVHLLSDEDVLDKFISKEVSLVIVNHGLAGAELRCGLNIYTELSAFEEIGSPDIENTNRKVDVDGLAVSLSGRLIPELAHGETQRATDGSHLLLYVARDRDVLAEVKRDHDELLQFRTPSLNHDLGSFWISSHVELCGRVVVPQFNRSTHEANTGKMLRNLVSISV